MIRLTTTGTDAHPGCVGFLTVAAVVGDLADLVGLAAGAVADLVPLVARYVALASGVGLGIEFLPEDLQRGVAVEFTEVVFAVLPRNLLRKGQLRLPILVEEDLPRRAVGSRCDSDPTLPILVFDQEVFDGELAEGTVGSLGSTEHQQNYDQGGESPLYESKTALQAPILPLQKTEPIFNCHRSRLGIIHSVPLCL